ncbi:MAG: hypothetical protein PHU34_03790 [Candidatus Methanoperedens sp.]|nr:hypothetical protein [Candidatus Methanoperedens sp.]
MNIEEFKEIVEQFDKTSILVIGDLMLDRFITGTVTRISPEAPVTVIDVASESFRLGGAANAINNTRALGRAVAEVLGEKCPVPMKIIGVNDIFGESGEYEELLKKWFNGNEYI